MICRLARLEDEAEIVGMARDCTAESLGYHKFDGEKLAASFRVGLTGANPTFFVVEQNSRLIGFLEAYVQEWNFTDGFFTVPNVTYVRPGKRGSRAAALLLGMFVRWSDNLGAKEAVGGNSNDFHSERTARFLERFGYKPVGFCMKRLATESAP